MIPKGDRTPVLLASLAGLIMGALTLTGWMPTAVELGLWTVVGVAWVVIALRAPIQRAFLGLTTTGLLAGIQTGLVQAAFAVTLVENNAAYAADITPAEVDGAFRGFLLVGAIGTGLVWGALFGLIAWGVRRWGPGRPTEADDVGA